jgi:hypothetical protein
MLSSSFKMKMVDAGLIHGNAMVARAAAFRHEESDADADAHAAAQQEEMKLLASQIWKWLRQQDCAMLLKPTPLIASSHEGQEDDYRTLPEEEVLEPQYFLLIHERILRGTSLVILAAH